MAGSRAVIKGTKLKFMRTDRLTRDRMAGVMDRYRGVNGRVLPLRARCSSLLPVHAFRPFEESSR